MEERLTLKAELREALGKKVKSLRKKGLLPAILYGHRIKNIPLLVNKTAFEKVFKKAGLSTLIDLKIDNERPKKVLIKETQRDPITSELLHVDFYGVKMTEKITTEIPLVFVDEAPAVKELDGTLITHKDSISVECLPDALVHEIPVSLSKLKTFEDDIKISDLKIPEGIEVLNEPDEIIVSVTPPRTEEELAELEAPVEEKVEEVEEVEKKEEEAKEEEEKTQEPEKIPESIQETKDEQETK